MEHTHDLLVEIEENDKSRLKIKLLRYFQSKKSNGGECDVDYTDGARTAVLRFRRAQDQKGVLEKRSHQMVVDNCVLKMTVRLLPDENTAQETTTHEVPEKPAGAGGEQPGRDARGGRDEAAAAAIGSTSALLANIPENSTHSLLELLVENILRGANSSSDLPAFTFEFLPDAASAVVTFQSVKEASDFVTRCPENSRFKKMGLSVQLLGVTRQVLVEDVENISEDLLVLYFESVGGEVESVVVNEVDQAAIITFKERTAAQNILKKKQHNISRKEFKVFAFHNVLGTALYGDEKPQPKLPNAFTESIHCAVWTYINSKQSAAESIRRDLKELFCTVNLDQPTVCLSPATELHQQKTRATNSQWREGVKAAFVQSISKFKGLEFSLEAEAWEEGEEQIRQMLLKEDVVVVADKAGGVISVAGPASAVDRVEQSLHQATKSVRERLQRQKSSVTEAVKLPPAVFSVLVQGDVKEQLCCVFPQLEMPHSKGSPDLIITGLPEEIAEVKRILFHRMLELKYQKLEMDCFVLDLLKEEQEEELTDVFLTSHGMNAAFQMSGNGLQLVAMTDRALREAEEHLGKLLITQDVDVEDINVLKTAEWDQQVRQTVTANDRLDSRIRIHTTDQKVVVCGHGDAVIDASRKLKDFLEQNAHVEETVAIKPSSILNYIKNLDTSQIERIQDKVALSYQPEAVRLSGSRAAVLESKSLLEKLVSSVCFDTLTVSDPGAEKLFQNLDNMSSLFHESGCLVQLVAETSDEQGQGSKSAQRVFQLQTSDATEIAVCKADICSYPVHAVVVYASQDLKPTAGLRQALLNAAGSQLQEECDRLVRTNGPLKPGDHVITGARGQLCCRSVIHAVVPSLDADPSRRSKGVAQLKKAIKGSLEVAEENGCVSVALPALSSASGFPLQLSTETIIKAVTEYFDERHEDVALKRVHFVDARDSSVKAMVAAVREQFKGQCGAPPDPPSASPPPPTTTSTPPRNQTPSHPSCLDHVQTREGLNVTLVIGNIEEATTDVTVNSVFRPLDLKQGALSNAILQAAGPQLQVLLNAGNSNGAFGDVIVTEGCQLKSKFVYHAVTPSWDAAQGPAEKTLSGIFRDCLNMAEDRGMKSISFPTIGTGKLGFPKALVAQLLYGEILKFSQKRQTKRVTDMTIMLYPGDTETHQAFTEELKKNFSKDIVSGHFSKILSSSGMYETKMGSVTVQVATGDITKETTDVIVNSSNDKFTLKQGVSKAVLEAAGQAVEAECQQLAASPNAGIIMTQAGKLQCKKIIHMVGQTKPALIHNHVKSVLQMCVANSYTSVSFPAIGTGQGNVKAKEAADAMLDAVIGVLSQNTSAALHTVRFVLFQPSMLKDFYSSMQQREAAGTKPASWIGSTMSKIRALLYGSAEKPQEEKCIIKTVEVKPVCFHICGKSQAGVDSAKKKINNLISREQLSNTITDRHISSLSQADCQRITHLQLSLSVKVAAEGKQGAQSLTIQGLGKDVLQATNDIQELLRKVREEEDLKVKVELAGQVAAWQYLQGTGFQNFDSRTNFKLEEARVNEVASVEVSIQGQSYTVQMPSGPATDAQGNSLQIRRSDKGEDIPAHWDAMPVTTSCSTVALAAGTAEHKQVQEKFQATCTRTILRIDRVQNPLLWKTLQMKKRKMEQKNGHQNNEKILFHGTSEETVAVINEHGFNRSFAGKNAACYGNGTYFAVNADYSAQDIYSQPNQNGEKHMYLCRVLTGDHALGQKGMVAPPPKTSTSVELYDSVVNNTVKPQIFVVFHDNHAYPEYLIKFK